MWQYGVPGNFWLSQKHRSREVALSGGVCSQCGSCPQGFRCLWELGYTMASWDSPAQAVCVLKPGPHGGYELWLLTATF